MVIRGGFRRKARTETAEGEMTHIEHPQEIIIGIIKEGLIALLVRKWSIDMTMRIIEVAIMIILITKGVVLKAQLEVGRSSF